MNIPQSDSWSRLTLLMITELPDEVSLRRERLELLLDVLPADHVARKSVGGILQHLNQADLLQREFLTLVDPPATQGGRDKEQPILR